MTATWQPRTIDFQENGSLAVIDDLLPAAAFEALAAHGEGESHELPRDRNEGSIWKFNGELDPVQSRTFVVLEGERYAPIRTMFPNIDFHPMGNPVDAALNAIRDVILGHRLFGSASPTWAGSMSRLFRFPPGSRLIWHSDGANYVGAYAYYIHRQWDKNDGGQFLFESGRDDDPFDGYFIAPKPNRLVVIRSPLNHAVTPAVLNTPTTRATLTGFFVRPEAVGHVIKKAGYA